MILLIAIIVPVLGFILQSYPRLFNRSFGVDVWTRLLEIQAFRNAHHRIPNKVEKGFIIPGNFDYPPVFPFLFSFFSKKTILKYQGFISPLIDSLQTILVFVICYQMTNSIAMSLVAQLVYIMTPMVVVENSYLTPRSLGYLSFTIAFYPLISYQLNPTNTTILIAVITSTILFLTHRFALQAYLFICVFMASLLGSVHFVAVPILGFTLAVITTRGYYLRVAHGHLSNIYFWVINYRFRFAHQIYGLSSNKKSDWVGIVYKLLSDFSPIFLLITNVWAASSFVFLYLYHANNLLDADPILSYFALWILFFYILGCFVLRFKFLIPIGEGQRYLEMCTVPASILTSFLVFYLYGLYGTLVVVGFTSLVLINLCMTIYIQIKGIIKDKNRSLTPELEKVYAFINKLPGNPRIMCIPHQVTTMTVFNTKADVLVNADNPGLMKLEKFFPILKDSIYNLKKEYSLNYILLRESFARESDLSLPKSKVVFREGDIKLIKI